jgi:hypothetical protein
MNPEGHSESLVASHPGNKSCATHTAYSPRSREPRAREVAEAFIDSPHTVPLDAVGATEGRPIPVEPLISLQDSKGLITGTLSRKNALWSAFPRKVGIS